MQGFPDFFVSVSSDSALFSIEKIMRSVKNDLFPTELLTKKVNDYILILSKDLCEDVHIRSDREL